MNVLNYFNEAIGAHQNQITPFFVERAQSTFLSRRFSVSLFFVHKHFLSNPVFA